MSNKRGCSRTYDSAMQTSAAKRSCAAEEVCAAAIKSTIKCSVCRTSDKPDLKPCVLCTNYMCFVCANTCNKCNKVLCDDCGTVEILPHEDRTYCVACLKVILDNEPDHDSGVDDDADSADYSDTSNRSTDSSTSSNPDACCDDSSTTSSSPAVCCDDPRGVLCFCALRNMSFFNERELSAAFLRLEAALYGKKISAPYAMDILGYCGLGADEYERTHEELEVIARAFRLYVEISDTVHRAREKAKDGRFRALEDEWQDKCNRVSALEEMLDKTLGNETFFEGPPEK